MRTEITDGKTTFNVTESLKDKSRKMIPDSDTYNEIDNQFALALSLTDKVSIS